MSTTATRHLRAAAAGAVAVLSTASRPSRRAWSPTAWAAGADLLLNLWHSAPAPVVQRFRRSAFVDTDPGLLQIWMTTGAVDLAPHDIYFTIGETVGQPGAPFPDGGRAWLYTPPPIFLPEWPALPPSGPGQKRVSFLEYLDLPTRTPVPLELAVCLAEHYDEYRQLMEPKGWTLREAWDVSATPEAYRAYVRRSRGEFSCAKPAYVALQTAWVSDRTLCYLASGKPAVVQHTGLSRWLPIPVPEHRRSGRCPGRRRSRLRSPLPLGARARRRTLRWAAGRRASPGASAAPGRRGRPHQPGRRSAGRAAKRARAERRGGSGRAGRGAA